MLTPGSSTADEPIELIPRCGGAFQLCGYSEKGSGTRRIPERFEVAQPFSGGLAAVRIEGQWGYIDRAGNIVISPRFKAAGPFGGKYAEVRIGNASGVIDRSGQMVIPARFSRIIPFANSTFVAYPLRDSHRAYETKDGSLSGLSDTMSLLSRSGAGLYHIRKGWITDQNLEFDIFDTPERGLIWASGYNARGDNEWGLMRSDGSWQVTPRYNHVQRLSETHAVVESMSDYSLPPQQRWDVRRRGAVDRNGTLVVPLKFAQLSYWRGGYGLALEDKPYGSDGKRNDVREGIVRADGSLLADRFFDKVEIREDGTLPRGRIGKRWYSIDRSGRLIHDELDGEPIVECKGGLTIIRRGEEVEFLRPRDKKSVGRFEMGFFQQRGCPGPFTAKREGRWYYVMEDGTILGGRNGFENTYSFSGTHGLVQVDGKWGIIDRTGKFTVEPSFDKLRPDRNDSFAVGEGEATYWIDASGKRIEKPAIARPSPAQALTCVGGLRYFQKQGLWGFQDDKGRTVIEPRFRALSCFEQGVSWAVPEGGLSWCPIGPDGKGRVAMECRQSYYPFTLSHSAPESFSDDPFENSVLWVRAWLEFLTGDRAGPPQWVSGRGNGGRHGAKGGQASKEADSMTLSEKAAIIGMGSLFAMLVAHWWSKKA